MGPLNDDLLRNKRSSLGMQVGETSPLAFICLHKHTCEVGVKPQTLRVSGKGSAKELHWETRQLSRSHPRPYLPDLCSACRGVLLKGLPCSEKQKKKKKKKKTPSKIQSLRWYLESLLPMMLHPPPTPPLSFLMMYHIRDLSEIGLKMTYWAYLADNIKGYGNGYLSFHQRAFQTF